MGGPRPSGSSVRAPAAPGADGEWCPDNRCVLPRLVLGLVLTLTALGAALVGASWGAGEPGPADGAGKTFHQRLEEDLELSRRPIREAREEPPPAPGIR